MKIFPFKGIYDPPDIEAYFNAGQHFAIFRNGTLLPNAIGADDEEGEAICHYVPTSEADDLPDDAELLEGEIPSYRLRGRIQIIPLYVSSTLLSNLSRLTDLIPSSS